MNLFFRKRRPQVSAPGEANLNENKGGVPREVLKKFTSKMLRSLRKVPKEVTEGIRLEFLFVPETPEEAKEIADYLSMTGYKVLTHVKDDDSIIVSCSSAKVKLEELSLLAAIDEMYDCAEAADVQFRNINVIRESLSVNSTSIGS